MKSITVKKQKISGVKVYKWATKGKSIYKILKFFGERLIKPKYNVGDIVEFEFKRGFGIPSMSNGLHTCEITDICKYDPHFLCWKYNINILGNTNPHQDRVWNVVEWELLPNRADTRNEIIKKILNEEL